MREVLVNKPELLAKVRENRAQHIKEYLEASTGYRKAALVRIDEVMGELKARVGRLKEGQCIDLMAVSFGLDVPESHESDYNRVITMLEMSTEDVIKLSNGEFAQYVMDDWAWQADFKLSNSRYTR